MSTSNVLRESLAGGHVKGAMVRAHLQWLRERLGEQGISRVLAALPRPAAAAIESALASTWCQFEHLILFDKAILALCGRGEGDLLRELGRHSAQVNLTTLYRVFRRDDIHEFFRRGAALHSQFQDFGTCDYEAAGDGHGRILIRNAVCFSPAYCASAIGYYEQVIALHGGAAASVKETNCTCAGADDCTYELRWR